MAETAPVARSPISPPPPEVVIAGWVASAHRSVAALRLTDHTPLAKVSVKASWDGPMSAFLGVPFGRVARQTWEHAREGWDVLLIGSAPGEWLALAAPGQQAALRLWLGKTASLAHELVTVVDMTHGRALVRLTGARSPDLLAKECSLDLGGAAFPDASAAGSVLAGVSTDVVRDDRDGARSYLLHCERSSGQYLADSLLDSGREFGVEADGFVPPGI